MNFTNVNVSRQSFQLHLVVIGDIYPFYFACGMQDAMKQILLIKVRYLTLQDVQTVDL